MRSGLRSLLEALEAGLLDGRDLLANQGKPGQVAPELGQRVRRKRPIVRHAQGLEALRGLAQFRLEAADAEPGPGALHPIHVARALADQALALAARAFGVLVLNRRNRHHSAVSPLVQVAHQAASRW